MPASSGVLPVEDDKNNNPNPAAVVRPPLISDMITTSIAESASSCKDTYELKDWEELQETLARASGLYNDDDLLGSISLLRAVIHECHRFLRRFPDPSQFFSRPVPQRERDSRSPDPVIGLEDRLWDDTRSSGLVDKWKTNIDRMSTDPIPDSDDQSHRHHESPTALHAVLGIALFLFGNIIAQNTTLALSREPTTPSPYWLAALDVFDAGNNLPCHTGGNDSSDSAADDDWRVAIAWGRSLVSLAYEATKSSPPPSPSPLAHSPSSPRSHTQRYPPRSPLATIAALRMPGTAHSRASAQELLTYAADQFARGIFHMPHSLPHAARPHELFTLASEVLAVAERLDDAEARRRWATWADAVFHQMHIEADVDAWRARIAVARGRCWLAAGSARADEMEDALERDDVRVLQSKEAEDSRAALVMAISFFDRAKGSASTDSPETSLTDMQPLLAEALLSLANLTADVDAREALYARAQVEGGEAVRRELGPSPTSSGHTLTADIRMDES
ncbi:hypothetical protein BJV78DRAFT_1129183 [Lactifluus subvellereus]|nr:hypothetical protein BJV78DRAFT_1129183 [Lactifluus subvellereus]